MDYLSTYGRAYLPKTFFSGLTRDIFNKPSDYVNSRISYPWLVRFYRLFEAVSDWLILNKNVNADAITLINAWSKTGSISSGLFSSDTGRLISSSGLSFVKAISPNVSDADIDALYSAISKVLKRWDEWYLDSMGNKVQGAVSQLAPIAPTYARILIGSSYYQYGTDPSLSFMPSVHQIVGTVYEVSYMLDRDKDFTSVRINPAPVINSSPSEQIAPKLPVNQNTDGLVIDGPINLDTLAKFKEAKDSGKSVIIRGFSGGSELLDKAQSKDDELNQRAVNDEVSRTPILDWLSDASDKSE